MKHITNKMMSNKDLQETQSDLRYKQTTQSTATSQLCHNENDPIHFSYFSSYLF